MGTIYLCAHVILLLGRMVTYLHFDKSTLQLDPLVINLLKKQNFVYSLSIG